MADAPASTVCTNLYGLSSKSAVLQDSETFPAKHRPVERGQPETRLANFLLRYGEAAGDCSGEGFVKTI